jgi:hypothetical protein
MVKNQTEYDKNKLQINTERQRAKRISFLQKEATKYGFILQNAVG